MFSYQETKNIWPKFIKSKCLSITNILTLVKIITTFAILFTFFIILEKSLHSMDTRIKQNNTIEKNNTFRMQSPQQYIQKLKEVPSNPDITLSYVNMNNKRLEFNKRKQKIENICTSYTDKDVQLHSNCPNIIISSKHRISWCPIYKAGSSIWMKNFAILRGILTDRVMNLVHENAIQINTIIRQAFPSDINFNDTLQKLHDTKKFLIVRHPFERLLSAYRDKLEHIDGREYYYKRFGRHITYKYRQNKNSNETKLEPTFKEFLEYIANEQYFDEHWAPYYDTCKPCMVHYDYILKFESFQEDNYFFIQETGLKYYLSKNDNFRNINPHGPTTNSLLKKYLNNIPKLLLQKIYKIYEKDFELFSYSPDFY